MLGGGDGMVGTGETTAVGESLDHSALGVVM
jgi:hypothetical protein